MHELFGKFMKKTIYEKKVESGKTEPLQGLDVVLIDFLVCNIIKGKYSEDDISLVLELWDDIEFIYKDDKETIDLLEKIINKK